MTDHHQSGRTPAASWWQPLPFTAACVLVVAIYVALGWSRVSELGNRTPREAYYNLLVDGFRAGHLHLALEPPAALAALPDPYDPAANEAFRGTVFLGEKRLHDLTYYRGKLYLYFGVTPAVLLFWPYAAATGHYLEHAQAATIFVSIAFLAGAWLLRAAWRRYFPETPGIVVAAAALAFGLGAVVPVVLSRPDVWEVPITCGYALAMVSLVALWRAVHGARGRAWALAAASLAYGLAVGARPSLLFGGAFLLIPVALAWVRRRDPDWAAGNWRQLLAAAVVPMAIVGAGLALYNFRRFGSPTEFGQTFQMAGDRQDIDHFSASYLWFNYRAYFFAFQNWIGSFPFLEQPALPPMPAGHGGVERPFALLTHAPFAWLALAAPLAWRGRAPQERGNLRAGIGAIGVLFLCAALTMGLFYGTCLRYEVEFAPALFLLAALGAFAVDRALAGRRLPRAFFHAGAGVLLVASLAGNLFAAAAYRGSMDHDRGYFLILGNRAPEAVPVLQSAVRLLPSRTKARMDLSVALLLSDRRSEASEQLAEALRRDPASAPEIYEGYAPMYFRSESPLDVVTILQAAVAAQPGSARLRNDYGAMLANHGRYDEAAVQLQEAVRIDPEAPSALSMLGLLARREGRIEEARRYLERAQRADPGNATIRGHLQSLPPQAGP